MDKFNFVMALFVLLPVGILVCDHLMKKWMR